MGNDAHEHYCGKMNLTFDGWLFSFGGSHFLNHNQNSNIGMKKNENKKQKSENGK